MNIRRIAAVSTQIIQIVRPNKMIQNLYPIRHFNTNEIKHSKALKTEKEKIRMYVVQRYIDYVNNYSKLLENRFPTAVKMYRVFKVGIRDFLKDLKTYISLRLRIASDKGFTNLTRKEIELFHSMPSDMWRITPVLILSAVPFGNYIIFPLAFFKPKALLCSHFWSIQQKTEFSTQDLSERLRHNKPVFRALQVKLESIQNSDLKIKWKRIIAQLGSGVHPSPEEILYCKELFTSSTYHLDILSYNHLGHLLKMHGLKKSIFRVKKLKHRAFILLEMDKAIIREGGVSTLNMKELRYACFLRGLNGSHLSNNDMKKWLTKWLLISQNVDKNSYSLLLHCPILLAYNHPQNWVLIY